VDKSCNSGIRVGGGRKEEKKYLEDKICWNPRVVKGVLFWK